MKLTPVILAVVAVAATASAQTLERPIGPQKPVRSTATPPPLADKSKVQGALPRAARSGNPLQMINPKAPAKYGPATQNLSFDPYTGKWNGIKLFEIFF